MISGIRFLEKRSEQLGTLQQQEGKTQSEGWEVAEQVMEVNVDLRTCNVTEGMTEDAVSARLYKGPFLSRFCPLLLAPLFTVLPPSTPLSTLASQFHGLPRYLNSHQ